MHAPARFLIAPQTLLLAYRSGVFPMSDAREDGEVFWVEPRRRAVFGPGQFRCSRSLARVLKSDGFAITVNRAFDQVIEGCAAPGPDRPETWISHTIEASYRQLHQLGHAHSVECWQDGQLVGGLYGVSFARVFCGESMFSRRSNASKVALAWLVALMQRAGYLLLDCQFMTPHLASLGAEAITREEYRRRLEEAQRQEPGQTLADAWQALRAQSQGAVSSPGKLIAQSFTHTS